MLNLKIERTKIKLTQPQFAEHLEVSVQSIKDWEQGRSLPSAEMLLRIANKLKVSIDYLLEGVE